MRLVVLGGGGFRVPLVHGALLGDTSRASGHRGGAARHRRRTGWPSWATCCEAARRRAGGCPGRDRARPTSTGRSTAATSSSRRSGSAASRGARSTSASPSVSGCSGRRRRARAGVGYGLRSVPAALHIARRVQALAPDAWVINFTNPAGLVTQAMQTVLGDRVVGICDSPLGLARRAAGALGHDLADLEIDYAGLNHLGWLSGLRLGGRDLLPGLLADAAALGIDRGGPPLRHRLAPVARDAPQRVPLLLLLHP